MTIYDMEEKQAKERNIRYISLRVKLLVGFTLLFSIVFALAFFWFYDFAIDKAMGQIEENLLGTLKATIEGVNGDEFEKLAKEGKPGERGVPDDDPRYQRHQQGLHTVQRIEKRSIPYTFVKGEKEYEILWIGDIFRIIRPADQTTFRESYIARPGDSSSSLFPRLEYHKRLLNTCRHPEEKRPGGTKLYQGLTTQTTSMMPYRDPWGLWVSAYGPIKNSQGEVVGGVGIDFDSSYVCKVQQAILDKVGIAFAITYTSLFALVFLISRALTRPIRTLTIIAERVAEGDYDQDISTLYSGRLRDEVSTLAQVFEIMVGKVRNREETLKKQVAELKIEIDEVKRQKQVRAIVESESFQDLQAKAAEMRRRRSESVQRKTKKTS